MMLLNCGVREDSWESLGLQGNQTSQSWIFIGRTDAEAEAPILWPPDVKNWLTGKGPDAGKDWRQEEKWTREDELVGWHHQPDGHGKPGVLQPMGSQRVRHDWETEMNWTTFPRRLYKWINIVCPFTCWWTFGLLSSKESCYEYSCTSLCMDTYILFSWVKTELFDMYGASQEVLLVKNPPSNAGDLRDPWVNPCRFNLGQEDPLEERMATHPSILDWKITWTEELGRLRSIGAQRLRHNWSDLAHTHAW